MTDAITPDQIHRELAPLLAAMPPFEFSAETIDVVRSGMVLGPPTSTDSVERTDHVVDEARGVVVRVHLPRGVDGPRPCAFSIHGGGYIVGNREMDDAKLGRWAGIGCVGVSVEYRLAPQTRYPGPLDDCYDALAWVLDRADDFGIDRDRVGVAGVSAGGGLAAALALRARDHGAPPLAFQLLECPMLDDRQRTQSSRLDDLPIWDRHANTFGWQSYLGSLYGTDDIPATAAPARASDLSGLPPAFVAVGSIDGFHDENLEYATRLNRAGVPTEVHVYPGAPHGFQLFGDSSVAAQAERDVDEWLARRIAIA
ncbi:MAG TPA: alpha/beta hydrolase [Acidimicrobiia bacterium]|nr:alpha/beta hydrolase [Acidimicrobiia bacterium]